MSRGCSGQARDASQSSFVDEVVAVVVNPFRAPKPLHILYPSNLVPENGIPVVKALLEPNATVEVHRGFVFDTPQFQDLFMYTPSTKKTDLDKNDSCDRMNNPLYGLGVKNNTRY